MSVLDEALDKAKSILMLPQPHDVRVEASEDTKHPLLDALQRIERAFEKQALKLKELESQDGDAETRKQMETYKKQLKSHVDTIAKIQAELKETQTQMQEMKQTCEELQKRIAQSENVVKETMAEQQREIVL